MSHSQRFGFSAAPVAGAIFGAPAPGPAPGGGGVGFFGAPAPAFGDPPVIFGAPAPLDDEDESHFHPGQPPAALAADPLDEYYNRRRSRRLVRAQRPGGGRVARAAALVNPEEALGAEIDRSARHRHMEQERSQFRFGPQPPVPPLVFGNPPFQIDSFEYGWTRVCRAQNLGKKLRERIEKLELPEWQHQVFGRIFHYGYMPSASTDNTTEAEQIHHEQQVVLYLEKLEKLAKMSVLKLIVWRAECRNHPTKPFSTYLDSRLWHKEGWKENKSTHVTHSALDIIAQNVQPFL